MMAAVVRAMMRRPIERARNRRRLEITGPRAIREEQFVSLGGVEQWVTIRGHDRDNPVCLVVHGGPGSSYVPFNSWLGGWENELVVAQWDQRGSGRTFLAAREDGAAPELSLERIAADGIELGQRLAERFNRKVLLVGSSVGSLLGAIICKRRPELFRAFVAANVLAPDPDRDGYRLVHEWATRRNDRRALRALIQIGPDRARWSPDDSLAYSRLAIRASEGVPDMVSDLMLPALMYDPGLSMSDLRRLEKGMAVSLRALQPEYENFDFDALGYDFELPVTVVQGEGDLVSPATVARRHFDRIKAPAKRFVVVPGAGHLVEFADPARFLEALSEVLR